MKRLKGMPKDIGKSNFNMLDNWSIIFNCDKTSFRMADEHLDYKIESIYSLSCLPDLSDAISSRMDCNITTITCSRDFNYDEWKLLMDQYEIITEFDDSHYDERYLTKYCNVLPRLVSEDIVSVQPMLAPTSNLFYLDTIK